MLRNYDLALVEKLGAVLSDDGKKYTLAVAGLPTPVELGMGLPEDWWEKFTLPGVNVARLDMLPDPSRAQPAFRAIELSSNPATPDTYNVQKDQAQPVNLLYKVELATKTLGAMNALVEHSLLKLPLHGYGTYLSVWGATIPFRSQGIKDRTNYATREGRVIRYEYTYVIEGWFIPSLECEKVPAIGGVEFILETDIRVEPK
jgi:hypothetical protein